MPTTTVVSSLRRRRSGGRLTGTAASRRWFGHSDGPLRCGRPTARAPAGGLRMMRQLVGAACRYARMPRPSASGSSSRGPLRCAFQRRRSPIRGPVAPSSVRPDRRSSDTPPSGSPARRGPPVRWLARHSPGGDDVAGVVEQLHPSRVCRHPPLRLGLRAHVDAGSSSSNSTARAALCAALSMVADQSVRVQSPASTRLGTDVR